MSDILEFLGRAIVRIFIDLIVKIIGRTAYKNLVRYFGEAIAHRIVATLCWAAVFYAVNLKLGWLIAIPAAVLIGLTLEVAYRLALERLPDWPQVSVKFTPEDVAQITPVTCSEWLSYGWRWLALVVGPFLLFLFLNLTLLSSQPFLSFKFIVGLVFYILCFIILLTISIAPLCIPALLTYGAMKKLHLELLLIPIMVLLVTILAGIKFNAFNYANFVDSLGRAIHPVIVSWWGAKAVPVMLNMLWGS